MSEAETWRYLCQVIGHWALRGYGRWMVTTQDDDTALGLIGLHNPLNWPEPEIGWILWSRNGQGFATEAARAARNYAYDTLGWTTAISLIDPQNVASRHVATRLGATKVGDHRFDDGDPAEIFRHPGPEVAS